MFNMWKPFPQYIPKKRGWYICSIRYGEEPSQAYVMDLFWDDGVWKDNRRLNVFQQYEVLGYDIDDITGQPCKKQIFTDNLCFRADVIAFKKCPKIYK